MAQQRIKTADLARLFNSADQPIYVLDDELTIRFCNEACAAWLGTATNQIIGRRCVYHSSTSNTKTSPIDSMVEGLCPPPDVLSGQKVSGTVAIEDEDGLLCRRHTQFIPVASSDTEILLVVALVDPFDLDESVLSIDTTPHASSDQGLERPEPNADQLHDQIRRFRQEAAARYGADRLLGNSPAMQLARARIELAAAGRVSVLIWGPTGSGRQHVAHAVHYASDPQHEGTLIPLDCAVLGTELIRSTVQALVTNPLGKRAAKSTLLFSDADLLPIDVQAEVASMLGSKSFLPRIVATAAEPLQSLVKKGDFDPQLAALLGTITIKLTALIDRREDIPLLAQIFLEDINAQGKKQLAGFKPETLDRLDAYTWPGNLDELAAVVSHAHQQAEVREILPKDLPKRLHQAADAAAHPPREEETIQLDEFLGQIERELITRAIAQAKGNKTKAAALLGLTRPRLYRRMEQLGLDD